MTKTQFAPYLLLTITFIVIFTVLSLDPIAQNEHYHHFKDDKTILGISNFLNVSSNLPFLLIGIWGIWKLRTSNELVIIKAIQPIYFVLFFSVACIAFGSAYYHLSPTHNTLVWDRIPISTAFMALFTIAIAELISVKIAKRIFLPIIALSVLSVFYWQHTESIGEGDLRFYALVQLIPIILLPIILLLYSSRFSKSNAYWWLLISYLIAKIFETYDAEIYLRLQFISGHTLKHLAAAIGIFIFVNSFTKRTLLK